MRNEQKFDQTLTQKQRAEQKKAAAWLESTCQFHYELEKLVNDSLLTLVSSEQETWLLKEFISKRRKVREEFKKYDPSAVFAAIMQVQPLALEIVECMKSDNIRFTIVEGA